MREEVVGIIKLESYPWPVDLIMVRTSMYDTVAGFDFSICRVLGFRSATRILTQATDDFLTYRSHNVIYKYPHIKTTPGHEERILAKYPSAHVLTSSKRETSDDFCNIIAPEVSDEAAEQMNLIIKLLSIFDTYDPFVAGGWLRDVYFGRTPKDIDIFIPNCTSIDQAADIMGYTPGSTLVDYEASPLETNHGSPFPVILVPTPSYRVIKNYAEEPDW